MQAVSLILIADDMSKMVDAVSMRRKIYANFKKAIQYIRDNSGDQYYISIFKILGKILSIYFAKSPFQIIRLYWYRFLSAIWFEAVKWRTRHCKLN